jgi:hypothetical protein
MQHMIREVNVPFRVAEEIIKFTHGWAKLSKHRNMPTCQPPRLAARRPQTVISHPANKKARAKRGRDLRRFKTTVVQIANPHPVRLDSLQPPKLWLSVSTRAH